MLHTWHNIHVHDITKGIKKAAYLFVPSILDSEFLGLMNNSINITPPPPLKIEAACGHVKHCLSKFKLIVYMGLPMMWK